MKLALGKLPELQLTTTKKKRYDCFEVNDSKNRENAEILCQVATNTCDITISQRHYVNNIPLSYYLSPLLDLVK